MTCYIFIPHMKHTKKMFIKTLNKKFKKDFDLPDQMTGYRRFSPISEFTEYAKKREGKHSMTCGKPYDHAGSIPFGQRQHLPNKLFNKCDRPEYGLRYAAKKAREEGHTRDHQRPPGDTYTSYVRRRRSSGASSRDSSLPEGHL